MARIEDLRQEYHASVCNQIIALDKNSVPNIADRSSRTSSLIARSILEQLPYETQTKKIPGQTAGRVFEELTKVFLEKAFQYLHHLRPAEWLFSVADQRISAFEQYEHLADLQRAIESDATLATALGGDYLVTPDIVIARSPLTDVEINKFEALVDDINSTSQFTPLRLDNQPRLILHASISCKWTIRSDRAQNTRAEALNLIRNRRGHTPHIAVITAEPMPSRLASLTLGTGDLDCTYHFALHELLNAAEQVSEDQHEFLQTMVHGKRLRDISDLPFDLVV